MIFSQIFIKISSLKEAIHQNVVLKAKYLSAFLVRFYLGFCLAIALCLSMCSCSSSKHAVTVVDRTIHDTLYLNKIQYDSIYKNDSFLMDYHPSKDYVYLFDSVLVMKVDTMYIRDKNIEYKYKFLHDTCYVHQVDTIPVIQQVEVVKQVKYTPWYAKAFAWIGAVALGVLIVLLLRFVIKKFNLLTH